MMREKHMPDLYWDEAASMAVYLMNRCTIDGVHELTPYEILVGRKPILSHLKVFESIANVRISNEDREKPDAKLEDVIFDESASWYKPGATPSDPIEEELNANSDEETRPSPLPKDNPSASTR